MSIVHVYVLSMMNLVVSCFNYFLLNAEAELMHCKCLVHLMWSFGNIRLLNCLVLVVGKAVYQCRCD